MWMSNDCVPLKNVESPYGGGVSSLPGAAGDPPPVMFPVVSVLLAGGPQLGPWQVAVVQVDETPAGDSSEQEYPCATPNRHWPMACMSYMTALHILLWKGALLAQKLKNHLRCWFLIMLTLLASMLLFGILRDCWSIHLHGRIRTGREDLRLGAGGTSGSGHYPGQST